MNISTFVIFDIETTGLPHQEWNETKITELSFVAVSARDIELTPYGSLPLVNKLSLLFNPQRQISSKAVELSGLTNAMLANQPVFKDKITTINGFLEDLPKPVCLVAHNGNRFDFKMILTEYKDAKIAVPVNLLCIDSLIGFRTILKNYNDSKKCCGDTNVVKPMYTSSLNSTLDDIMKDDEDDWPEINACAEGRKEIDELTPSLSNISCSSDSKVKILKKRKNTSNKDILPKKIEKKENISYSLSNLYRLLLKKDPVNAHRAEIDCIMLLECVIATKSTFLQWANSSAKQLINIKPYKRSAT